MKIGALSWSGNNIGDDIQTAAVIQHLPPIDVFIHRDHLNTYDGPETLLVLNGWFLDETENWPPSDRIKPIFFGFHVQKRARANVARHAEYLKRHEPIGCRDPGTTEFIRSLGVDAYLSYCATLTFNAPAQRNPDSIYFVEANSGPFGDIKSSKGLKIKNVSHRFIDVPWENRLSYAKGVVETYGRLAKYVVTSRIHCAMPCVAMGIPTAFVGPDNYRTRIIDEVGIPRLNKPSFWNKIFAGKVANLPQLVDISATKSRITTDLTARIERALKQ
ncbi:polysaccharide pyruvyl transferase family protein [Mesorhizobium sp. KR9-304]|uniref:polysaccharide pyruvyl transferase family protein n=1 Tax=Mesorhizobium sp. KR9-304 TaxID=3156614 RepID=UPI0032B559CD